MLPPANRLRRSTDFQRVIRAGARTRRGNLVVHVLRDASDETGRAPRVGLVVGRLVGNSVVRHRVSRKLRAQLFSRLELLPERSDTVVRALPGAAGASSADLGADLDSAFDRLVVRS